MSKKANPTVIGVFIALGLFLLVGGIIFFSSSRLFTTTTEYILYFDATLGGLDAGAAVKFRGVTIGTVKEVLIHHNQQPTDPHMPVIIEINEDLLKEKTDVPIRVNEQERIQKYIQLGLRARLETRSFLTGLLYVNLEFLPETPITYHQLRPQMQEIPTAPSQAQVFVQDLARIIQNLNVVLGKLDTSLEGLQTQDLSHSLTNLMTTVQTLASSPDLTNTLASSHQAINELRLLLNDFRPELAKLTRSADLTLTSSRATLDEVRDGVQDLRDILAPRGALRGDLSSALEELADAARAVAALADFLNQHPNAILSGRSAVKSKP